MKALRSSAVLIGLIAIVLSSGVLLFLRSPVRYVTATGSSASSASSAPTLSVPRFASTPEETKAATGKTSEASRAKRSFDWDRVDKAMALSASKKLITKEEAEQFLRTKGVTPVNLLAAANATGDKDFIRRAATLFADHPAVQLAVLGENLFPEATSEWISRFKASSPENPLPFLYAARAALEQQDFSTALAETSLALEKPGLYLWHSEFSGATRQMYEWKGYDPLEAEILAALVRPAEYLMEFNNFGGQLWRWREQVLKEGNTTGAEEAVRVTYGLGRMFQSSEGSRTFINQLIGISLESRALKSMPPEIQASFLDIPWAEREAEMMRQREFIRSSQTDVTALLSRRDPELLAGYLRRNRELGEYHALIWLKEQLK